MSHNICINANGGRIVYGFYIDENDQHIARTPDTHPYNYDSYVLWRNLPNSEVTGTAYSDRMMSWDLINYTELWERICGKNQYWYAYPQEKILEFVRSYFEDPELEICYVMQCCNQSTGYPLWLVAYKQVKKENVDG